MQYLSNKLVLSGEMQHHILCAPVVVPSGGGVYDVLLSMDLLFLLLLPICMY